MNSQIYFDNAATTPIAPEVFEAMIPYLKDFFGNPSSTHFHGREVRSAIERERKKISEILNCTTSEIFFTSGGTEADNTIICGAIESYNIKHAITSPIEHHAVLHTLEHLQDAGLIELHLLEVDSKGNVNLDHLTKLLKEYPESLVSLMHANNEIANINDLDMIGQLCKASNSFLHSDTVQSVGHYALNMEDLHLNGLAASGHKFHGPKGTGFMYVNKENRIHAYIMGGSQERDMRGGTENVAGIVGLGTAIEIAYENLEADSEYIRTLKRHFRNSLETNFTDVKFNGQSAEEDSLYTVLNVSLPSGFDSSTLLFNLDIQGISASGGSACTSGSPQGSHVLEGIGSDPDRASVRFSFSKYNTIAEIDQCISVLKDIRN